MAAAREGWEFAGGAGDMAVTAAAGTLVGLAFHYSRRHVFRPLALRLGLAERGEAVVHKFTMEAWALLWHLSMLAWGLAAVGGEPWFHASVSPWTSPAGTLPFWDRGARMSARLRYLYLVQLGYYLFDLSYLYLYDREKKDFVMLVSHHIAAMLLIFVSYFPPPCDFVFIGSAIMLFHEVSDIFLYAAKLSKFAGLRVATPVFAVLAAASWGWFRIVNFPRIIYSAAYESTEVSARQQACVVMLCALYVLHVEWFRILCEVLWRAASGGGLDDPTRPDYGRGGPKKPKRQ